MKDNGRPEVLPPWWSWALEQLNEGIDFVFGRVQILTVYDYPIAYFIKDLGMHFV